MDVKLLEPVSYLGVHENERRIQTQKTILSHYTHKQQQQLTNDLKNSYSVDEVTSILKERVSLYTNKLYTQQQKNVLTPHAKKTLSHRIKVNRTVASEMEIEGQPIDSDPFYKPNVDSGKFANDLYNAMQNTINNYVFRKGITWIDFLNDQVAVRLNGFPSVTNDFLIELINNYKAQAKQQMKKHTITYKLKNLIKNI